MLSNLRSIALLLSFAASALAACGDDDDDATPDGDADADTDADSDADTDADVDADTDADVDADVDADADGDADPVDCTPGDTECTNCVDDDADGFTDGFDPHCTGAMDDDESSFETGIPGDNQDYRWQDCFFDGNSGGGNDCRYHVCCILAVCPEDEADSFNPETDCPITEECIDHCLDVTTPGCDCFGCCTICDENDVCRDVITNPGIAPDCDVDVLDDPVLCPACTMAEECSAPCEPDGCILCPGQDLSDLPEECSEGGGEPGDPVNECPDDRTPCVTSDQCEQGFYCSFGCCIVDSPF